MYDAMSVTVSGASGLTNAYTSVLSACGSLLMSGASRWLDARPGSMKKPTRHTTSVRNKSLFRTIHLACGMTNTPPSQCSTDWSAQWIGNRLIREADEILVAGRRRDAPFGLEGDGHRYRLGHIGRRLEHR